MSMIYFIRHAQASFGADNYDQLSPRGLRQAQVLARFLDTHGIRFDTVFSGVMERQIDTARPVCRRQNGASPPMAGPEVMAAFNEYNHEALVRARIRQAKATETANGLPTSDLRQDMKAFQAYFSETVDQWVDGAYAGEDGVEPWPDFCRRVSAGVDALMATQGRGKRLAVFTSGGPISVVVGNALGLSNKKTVEISWEIQNASLTCLKYNADKLSLTAFNNTTHFLIEGDATLLTHR